MSKLKELQAYAEKIKTDHDAKVKEAEKGIADNENAIADAVKIMDASVNSGDISAYEKAATAKTFHEKRRDFFKQNLDKVKNENLSTDEFEKICCKAMDEVRTELIDILREGAEHLQAMIELSKRFDEIKRDSDNKIKSACWLTKSKCYESGLGWNHLEEIISNADSTTVQKLIVLLK